MKVLLIILAMGLVVQSEELKFSHIKVNKEISLDLPDNFLPVPENEIRLKYNTAKRPIAMYTSIDRKTDFAINVLPTQWQENDLVLMKRFYRSNLLNLYDSVNILNEEIKDVNNRNFLVFEFISSVNPDPDAAIKQPPLMHYSYLQYTVVNGKVVVCSFTTPRSQMDKWKITAERIMSSLKIKKTL